MISVICWTTVTVMARIEGDKLPIPIMVTTQVHGQARKQDEEHYVVDFSKEAREKHYIGEYGAVLIHHTLCKETL